MCVGAMSKLSVQLNSCLLPVKEQMPKERCVGFICVSVLSVVLCVSVCI